ncbi:MAG: GntR family transcriptional regulator, partial [Clostridium sp.]|nr:GntR family transcriptional regulator [Clostridium sp.]
MTQANAFGTSESVFQYLNEGIRSGRWKPGDRLPSETQLCQEL